MSECIFDRQPSGQWRCLRPGCRYLTKNSTYEEAPHKMCRSPSGPGTMLARLLAKMRITERNWLRFVRLILWMAPPEPARGCQPCKKRAQAMDKFWYTSKWMKFPRWYVNNYRKNLIWLRQNIIAAAEFTGLKERKGCSGGRCKPRSKCR